MKRDEYKINPNIKTGGTSLRGGVKLKPIELLLVFGKPMVSDGYKVSGEYFFEHTESGTPITLYDWKYTTLYDHDGIKPVDFWKLDKEVQFNIGSLNSYAYGFENWIRMTIKNRLNEINAGLK